MGLGLATASQIVKFHRGSIRILSQPGGGTLIRLSLPGIPGEAGLSDSGAPRPGGSSSSRTTPFSWSS